MLIYNHINELTAVKRTVILGNFDGVHLGHQQLIKRGKQMVEKNKQELTVVTFYPQIQEKRNSDFKYIASPWLKRNMFEKMGVDSVLVLPFNEEISQMSPKEFVVDLLVKTLQAEHIVVGFNYTFGYKGAGTVETLLALAAEQHISVEVVPPVYVEDKVVNSTWIRQEVQAGNITLVNKLLGYPLTLEGTVIHGRKVGRIMGTPTANLLVDTKIALPPNGVYASKVVVNGFEGLGVLNVGIRPTVGNGTDTSIEVHILDFDQDIYGQHIIVELYNWLRGEMKFADLSLLKEQIVKDIKDTEDYFAQQR